MSDPIKPTGPGAGPPAVGPSRSDDAGFGDRVADAHAPKAGAPEPVRDAGVPADVSSIVAELSEALRQSQVSSAEAVDALIGRALDSALARRLTPAGRAELERLLRALVADDPHVADLVRQLERR